MHERDLACIPLARKHAFAEEDSTKLYTVKAADEPTVAPAFDAMRKTTGVKVGVQRHDFLIDPTFLASLRWRSACTDHRGEVGVNADREAIAANGSCKSPR